MRNANTILLAGAMLCALAGTSHAAKAHGLGRQVLPAGDGWASLPTAALPNGTTGGSAAAPERVHRGHGNRVRPDADFRRKNAVSNVHGWSSLPSGRSAVMWRIRPVRNSP